MTGSRRWKWWHVLLLVLGVGLAGLIAFVAAVYVSLIGGVDEIFRGDPPSEDDPQVVSAQQDAAGSLTESAGPLVQHVLGTHSGARLVAQGLRRPRCTQGQHNWKVDDDFDLVCDLEHLSVVVVDDPAFRDQTLALHDRLLADGWRDDGFSLVRVVTDYWDSPPRAGYSVDDLPEGRYADSGRVHRLRVDWVESDSGPDRIAYFPEEVDLRDMRGARVTPTEVVRMVPESGHAIVLAESTEYFRQ